MNSQFDYIFKIIIIGDADVGKSSALLRLTDHIFAPQHSTIGVEYGSKLVKEKDNKGEDVKIKLQIWDTAGQERFRSVVQSYFRDTGGIILIFDITNRRSFQSLGYWLQTLSEMRDTKIDMEKVNKNVTDKSTCMDTICGDLIEFDHVRSPPIILVGNKLDLENGPQDDKKTVYDRPPICRQVERAEAIQFARDNHLDAYIETSAKNNHNIDQIFGELTHYIYLQVQEKGSGLKGVMCPTTRSQTWYELEQASKWSCNTYKCL